MVARQLVFRWARLACSMNAWVMTPAPLNASTGTRDIRSRRPPTAAADFGIGGQKAGATAAGLSARDLARVDHRDHGGGLVPGGGQGVDRHR